jgi:hypothetical protein
LIDPTFAALAALAIFQIKHVICDFFLQTANQLQNKGRYGHPDGLVHAGIHVLGSIPVFLVLPATFSVALAVLALEFVLHYHIDWLKNEITSRRDWQIQDRQYWWAMGLDQFAHQMTYLGMTLALLVAG